MTGGVVRDGWRVREVVPGPPGFTRAVIVFRRPSGPIEKLSGMDNPELHLPRRRSGPLACSARTWVSALGCSVDGDRVAVRVLKDEGPAERGVKRFGQNRHAVGLELVMQRLGVIGAQR